MVVAYCAGNRNTTLRGVLRILPGVSQQSFGERLRSLRTRRRLTPSGLAHAAGVTEGAIRQMESGQTKSASFLVGLRLARILGVTPWYLATGEEAAEKDLPGDAPAVRGLRPRVWRTRLVWLKVVWVRSRAGAYPRHRTRR